MNSPKPLYKFLNAKKGNVADLITFAHRLARFNRRISKILDHPLTEHCQIANYNNGIMTLTVDSPVWASRMRYYIPTLTTELKQEFPELQGLKECILKVQPRRQEPRAEIPSDRHISETAGRYIEAMAESINDDKLKVALLRLAQRDPSKA